MNQTIIEQAISACSEWMEANKSSADAEAFACVAQATAQLAQIANKKRNRRWLGG